MLCFGSLDQTLPLELSARKGSCQRAQSPVSTLPTTAAAIAEQGAAPLVEPELAEDDEAVRRRQVRKTKRRKS